MNINRRFYWSHCNLLFHHLKHIKRVVQNLMLFANLLYSVRILVLSISFRRRVARDCFLRSISYINRWVINLHNLSHVKLSLSFKDVLIGLKRCLYETNYTLPISKFLSWDLIEAKMNWFELVFWIALNVYLIRKCTYSWIKYLVKTHRHSNE